MNFGKHLLKVITGVLLGMAVFFLFNSCKTSQKYSVGDIVFESGKVISRKKIQKYKGSEKPVAVIFSTDGAYSETGEKRILAVSLYSSAEKYSFENYNVDITLENVRHNAIDVVNQKFNESTGCYENDGFIGSHDGRNLFYNFTKAQKDNIGAYSDRFPAWKEAGEYGTNHNLKNSGTA